MKAQDFLVGTKEFFAVLVPGAVLLLLLSVNLPGLPGVKSDALTIFTFAIAAYVVGSVVSGLGAALDWGVDRVIDGEQFRIIVVSLGKRHAIAWEMRKAIQDRQGCVSPEEDKYFWRDYIRLNCPEGAAELDRHEANQKLFRSLSAVCGIVLLLDLFGLHAGTPPEFPGWLLVALLLVSLVMYVAGRVIFLKAVYRLAVACIVCREPDAS